MTQYSAIAHHYRRFRGNMERPAESAYQSARAHVHFLRRLDEMVKAGNKRSQAAKRGWKKRRASKSSGTKTKPYSRECLARDIPGASCQFPDCDC
jgi:hypothetical protein